MIENNHLYKNNNNNIIISSNNISLSNGNLTKLSNGSSEFSELNKEINHIIQEGGNLSEFSLMSNNNPSTNSSNFVNKNISNNNIIYININENGIWNKNISPDNSKNFEEKIKEFNNNNNNNNNNDNNVKNNQKKKIEILDLKNIVMSDLSKNNNNNNNNNNKNENDENNNININNNNNKEEINSDEIPNETIKINQLKNQKFKTNDLSELDNNKFPYKKSNYIPKINFINNNYNTNNNVDNNNNNNNNNNNYYNNNNQNIYIYYNNTINNNNNINNYYFNFQPYMFPDNAFTLNNKYNNNNYNNNYNNNNNNNYNNNNYNNNNYNNSNNNFINNNNNSDVYFNNSYPKKSHKKLKHKFEQTLFTINLEQILIGNETRTTIMIRHIPNKYTYDELLTEIDKVCKNKYDFFYLPLDSENDCNLGYSFINFIDPLHIIYFYKKFKAKKWQFYKSNKECDLSFAKFQGKNELTAHLEKNMGKIEDKKKLPLVIDVINPLPKIDIPKEYYDYIKKFRWDLINKINFV